MAESAGGDANGLFAALKGVAATLLASGKTRLELLGLLGAPAPVAVGTLLVVVGRFAGHREFPFAGSGAANA